VHGPPEQGQPKAYQMVIKQILEGARRFKAAPSSGPDARGGPQGQRRPWRWPEWRRWVFRREDEYLIDIRPRRSPKV
jgi:hypothetical protein